MKESNKKAVGYLCSTVTDTGRSRQKNQDAWSHYHGKDTQLFVLADGMGGAKGGEIASTMAVNMIPRIATASSGALSIDSICLAIQEANTRISEVGPNDPKLSGMGTTVVCLMVDQRSAQFAHVGDSRLYMTRGGELTRLSRDHTLVQDLLDNGTLTKQEAEVHPMSHMLTRALGQGDNVEIDVGFVEGGVCPGDKFLLCCDGLTDHVIDREIKEILNAETADTASEFLINLANARGGKDNITVHVVEAVEWKEEHSVDDESFRFSIDALEESGPIAESVNKFIIDSLPKEIEEEDATSLIEKLKAEVEADKAKVETKDEPVEEMSKASPDESEEVHSILPESVEEVNGEEIHEDDIEEETQEINIESHFTKIDPSEVNLPIVNDTSKRGVNPVVIGAALAVLLLLGVGALKPELFSSLSEEPDGSGVNYDEITSLYIDRLKTVAVALSGQEENIVVARQLIDSGVQLPSSLLSLLELEREVGENDLTAFLVDRCSENSLDVPGYKTCLETYIRDTSVGLSRLPKELRRAKKKVVAVTKDSKCNDELPKQEALLLSVNLSISDLEERIAKEGPAALLRPELGWDELNNPRLTTRRDKEVQKMDTLQKTVEALKVDCRQ